MDHLTSMQVFVRVVDRGGFSAAASAEGMSATMVGKHVRYLEERLGVRLLNRTTRRQSLTEVGRIYYERCKHALAEVADTDACVSEMQLAPRGVLRVSASVSFGVQALMPLVSEYLMRYPQVRVELVLKDRILDLVEDGIDVAIRIGKLPDSTLIVRPLAPYQLVVCASPAYLERAGTPRTPADLKQHNCLTFMYGPIEHVWSFVEAGKTIQVPVSGNLGVNSGQALRNAALAGVGIILQPLLVAADDIACGRLVPLLQGYAAPAWPLQVVTPFSRHMTPKLRSFIDCVVGRFGAQAASD